MDGEGATPDARTLADVADRLDALADTAELMDDEVGSCRLRDLASRYRLRAMALLDG